MGRRLVSAAAACAREPVQVAGEARREMGDAEAALRLARERFEEAPDPQAQAEVAAEALDYVERQLELARERRRALDEVEGRLWGRRNRLERFLIRARGIDWWHARRRAGSRDGHRGSAGRS